MTNTQIKLHFARLTDFGVDHTTGKTSGVYQ